MFINSEKFKRDSNNKIVNFPSNIVKANFIEWMIYFNRENLFITLPLNIWESFVKICENLFLFLISLLFLLSFSISFPILYFVYFKENQRRNKRHLK